MKHNKLITVCLILIIGVFLAAGCIGGGEEEKGVERAFPDKKASSKEIESCVEINQPGEYEIIKDLSSKHYCIYITADNVVLNGNNHTIIGPGKDVSKDLHLPAAAGGVLIKGNSNTVKNMKIKNFPYGIRMMAKSSQNTIKNNFLSNNKRSISIENKNVEKGQLVASTGENQILNNQITSSLYGIYLTLSNDNKIKNNEICNSVYHDIIITPPQQPKPTKKKIKSTGNTGENTCDITDIKGNNSIKCVKNCQG